MIMKGCKKFPSLLRGCYSLIFYLILPFILMRLLWRSLKNPEYRKRIPERLARIQYSKHSNGSIWVHAVSMGETIAAVPLIKSLIQQFPHHEIIVTTTTPTGSAQVKKLLGDTVRHVYIPYDLPTFVKRFLKRSKILFCIMMETELWPNILYYCKRKNIPIMLANARLSKRSFQQYNRIKHLTQSMLECYQIVAAQSQLDAEHFLSLGLKPQKLLLAGNIKFDLQICDELFHAGAKLRKDFGEKRPLIVAASTHEGEEKIILDAFSSILQKYADTLLILIPRHPERFEQVKKLCQESNFSLVQRSLNQIPTIQTQILLGDTMGEVKLFYAASDLAFVGGSLVPIGGHNLIEPAAFKLPVITGPHLENFLEISQLLLNAGGVKIIQDASDLATQIINLLDDTSLRQSIGQNAWKVVESNRGALNKHLQWINNHILLA